MSPWKIISPDRNTQLDWILREWTQNLTNNTGTVALAEEEEDMDKVEDDEQAGDKREDCEQEEEMFWSETINSSVHNGFIQLSSSVR